MPAHAMILTHIVCNWQYWDPPVQHLWGTVRPIIVMAFFSHGIFSLVVLFLIVLPLLDFWIVCQF
jgi:hypothetical protein